MVGSPGHAKDVVDYLNARDKQMPKLEMAKILNPELISDYPNCYTLMKFHENEENPAVSLETKV